MHIPELLTLSRLESLIIAMGSLPASATLRESDRLGTDLDMDSVDFLQLVMSVEDDLGVELDEDNLPLIAPTTAAEFLAAVNQQIQPPAPAPHAS